MSSYALLIHPSANRVYAGASVALTAAELAVANRTVLGGRLSGIGPRSIGGVPVRGLRGRPGRRPGRRRCSACCPPRTRCSRWRASCCGRSRCRAAAPARRRPGHHPEVRRQDQRAVHPAAAQRHAASPARSPPSRRTGPLTVLDPLCGRGTTLNQALMYGYDAAGVELDGKDVEAYAAFLQTWLKRKRIKHTGRLRAGAARPAGRRPPAARHPRAGPRSATGPAGRRS